MLSREVEQAQHLLGVIGDLGYGFGRLRAVVTVNGLDRAQSVVRVGFQGLRRRAWSRGSVRSAAPS
jgi:hypothetical protein